jgi:hypothetical protein
MQMLHLLNLRSQNSKIMRDIFKNFLSFSLVLIISLFSCIPAKAEVTPQLRERLNQQRESIFQWSATCIGEREKNNKPKLANLEGTATKFASNGDCDTGDSVLFNALICSSGEWMGCEAVKRAQGKDGRWWRSEQHVDIDKDINADDSKKKDTFSGDHALGVMLYLVEARNKGGIELIEARQRATKWMNWMNWPQRLPDVSFPEIDIFNIIWDLINGKDPNIDFPELSKVYPNGFCKDAQDDKCILYPWYLETMYHVWQYLGLEPHPLMTQVHKSMDKKFVVEGRETTTRRIVYAFQNGLSEPGFRSHIASIHLYIFKKLGLDDLNSITLWSPLKPGSVNNPFLLYLRDGSTNQISNLLMSHIQQVSKPRIRIQWYLERDIREEPYKESMGWDLITMSNFLIEQQLVGNFQWRDQLYFADRGYFCRYADRSEYESNGGVFSERVTIPNSIDISLNLDGVCTGKTKLRNRSWRHEDAYQLKLSLINFLPQITDWLRTSNALIDNFDKILSIENQKIASLQSWIEQNLNAVLSPSVTISSVNSLIEEYASKTDSDDTKICRTKRESISALTALRGKNKVIERIFTEYLPVLSSNNLAYFPTTKALLETGLKNLSALFDRLTSIINKNNITETPDVCVAFQALPVVYNFRIQEANVDSVTQQLGELNDELKQKLNDLEEDIRKNEMVENFKRSLLSIEAEFTESILKGYSNEALLVADTVEQRIDKLLSLAKQINGLTPSEITRLEDIANESSVNIQVESANNLSFSSLPILALRRLEKLRIQIAEVDEAVLGNTSLKTQWSQGPRQEIYAIFGIEPDRLLRLPRFSNEDDVLNYDATLALLESRLYTFRQLNRI